MDRDCKPYLTYEEWATVLEAHRPGALAELAEGVPEPWTADAARREYEGGCGAAWLADRLAERAALAELAEVLVEYEAEQARREAAKPFICLYEEGRLTTAELAVALYILSERT